jgi:RHS repeat-associated protein
LVGGTPYNIVSAIDYTRDRRPELMKFGDSANDTRMVSALAWTYESDRRRPLGFTFERQSATTMTGDIDEIGPFAIDDEYTWDVASNLASVTQHATSSGFITGHRPVEFIPTYDALYRVAKVDFSYHGASSWGTDSASDWRTTRATHRASDPMRERPAAMVSTMPSNRVQSLRYDYDWLANMTSWTDDASNFYERSIGTITNGGTTSGLRPSALYLSTNLPSTAESYSAGFDRGGWVEVDHGVSGNVVAMTVHARCSDQAPANVCYASGADLATKKSNLRSRCVCAGEQHYQYRYDELNRISEARRYDRPMGTGTWNLQVRQRYRYDAGNNRIIKQTIEHTPSPGTRIALYVFPGDYERSGVVRDISNFEYDADATLGTETQYLVGGARVVWKSNPPSSWNLSRDIRITYAITDLIQSTAMVFDVYSGELLETRSHYPNGATETHRAQSAIPMQLEPLSFTGKEADDEVGITYFGQRYLFQHLGRWTTPDPAAIHAVSGGESLNSYHYVRGNLLQARDPVGLWPSDVDLFTWFYDPEEAGRGAVMAVADHFTNGGASAIGDANRGREGAMRDYLAENEARGRAYSYVSRQAPLVEGAVGVLMERGGQAMTIGGPGFGLPGRAVAVAGAGVSALGAAMVTHAVVAAPGTFARADEVDRARRTRAISGTGGSQPTSRDNNPPASASPPASPSGTGPSAQTPNTNTPSASPPRARRNARLAGQRHPVTDVPFDAQGYPDFSDHLHPTHPQVRIEFSGNRATDVKRALFEARLDRTPENYVWHHHQDGRTMQLVERDIHRETGHDGGHAGR